MSKRLIDSEITRIVAVVGGLADVDKPSVAELEGAVDITCAVAYGSTFGLGASTVVTGKPSVCDASEPQNRGPANITGELTILREGDGDETATTSAYLAAAELLADPGTIFDLVRRGGVATAPASAKPQSEPFVAGDVVEVYRFENDYPQYRSANELGQDADFVVQLFSKGAFNHHATVVAGS